jgi:phosphatidylethanolamine-binding protein (PEBP) family uncharacterized protein
MRLTCQGEGLSSPLAWSDVPTNAKSLGLIVDYADAPILACRTEMIWVLWVVYNIPSGAGGLAEGATGANNLPDAHSRAPMTGT